MMNDVGLGEVRGVRPPLQARNVYNALSLSLAKELRGATLEKQVAYESYAEYSRFSECTRLSTTFTFSCTCG